ncbi:MAG TPA: phosphodiesterase [Nitrospirae bacterium]|nr:type I phosphodiesterase / nucleotide pyrophosphatase [bacterium BMS3Abin06]HDH12432.1 phosphodiesterase [Nitrospirota bacterium]HDZ02431.1 phosphodiesterase [Nitrospirota bacterium]
MTNESSVKVTGNPKYSRVILLGMDGLDPKIVSSLMEKGDLPNFTRLSRMGVFSQLATSNPAQSPVAWASIATGNNPGHHGVFDFLGRRVSDYMPVLAILKMNPKNVFGKREAMFLPVMQGNAFWDHTSANNIPSTILKWPMTFQPKQNRAKLFSGLGVPDIKGGLGRYAFYTTMDISENEEGAEKIIKVRKDGQKIKTHVSGPNVAKLRAREAAKVDLNINLAGDPNIEINIDGKRVTANKGQWSEWVEVKFKLGFMKTTTGIVKFYLNQVSPEFELYMTPVQINPKDPAFVISSPDEYIQELANEVGNFYTLGMPEDTKAIEEGRTDEEAFIAMCDEIVEEQEKMLWYELNKFKEGLLACAFFSTDRIQHIFWVTRDPAHPLYDKAYAEKYGHVIDDYYRKMDRILGEVMKEVDDKTALMVFSDHGFSSFRRTVHINSWLVQNGLMTLTQKVSKDDRDGGGLFQYVDWKKTQAYALGFGSIYLNIRGREKHGIVEAGSNAEAVADKIVNELVKLTDPKDGQSAVKDVYRQNTIYSGSQANNAPDLVVGFQDGYRSSWQTAIGGAPPEIIEDNLKKWSGDHIIDPSIVPGILLTNFGTNNNNPGLIDIAPTVLSCFGMSAEDMEGKTLI